MPPYIVMVLVVGVGLLGMVAVAALVGGWVGVLLGLVLFAVCLRALDANWER
ncbi:MAG: hypothetical protein M3340_17730 [Actinomycetota bacterium]|nr:hypothetical protein [Actinomycetota bacterium]